VLKTIAASLALIAGSTWIQAADSWKPRDRPDRAFGKDWQFVGCDSGAIDFSCFAGDLPGYLCRWQRGSDNDLVIREERYSKSGRFYLAYEETGGGTRHYRIVFFDRGRSHLRLSEGGPGTDDLYHADVVVRSVVTAQYVSAWDRIIAAENGELEDVPMDTRRVAGEPFLPIDNFHLQHDQRAIRSLTSDGYDLSRPRPIEFGFWFEDSHRATAIGGLAALGCKWRTVEERGKIGPYPGHCLMTALVDAATLADWHARFTKFAQDNGGHYYGWTHALPASD